MWEFIAGTLIASWLNLLPRDQPKLSPLKPLAWEQTNIFQLPQLDQDLLAEQIIVAYLNDLNTQGAQSSRQGIWVQSDWSILGSNQGQTPLPAASLTKVATTLAALNKWGTQHQFLTDVYLLGKVEQGVLQGDLLVRGAGDPLFVWEEAIALGNALNQLGIREVQGNLLVTDQFYMNFQAQSVAAGKLLQQALDYRQWDESIKRQYDQLPPETKLPQVTFTGQVQAAKQIPPQKQLLIRHHSLVLTEILRQMNLYSNNHMAQILSDLLGGAGEIAAAAQQVAGVAPAEIELVNGSGLGEANRISPRAVCQMLMALDRLLRPSQSSVADLLPTAARDTKGTVRDRSLPPGTAIKTGTLDRVSALAGAIPTSDRGTVYFSIINYGGQIEQFRQQQDLLLNQLIQPWKLSSSGASLVSENSWYLGDPQRNTLKQIN